MIGHGGFEGGDELVWGAVNALGHISLYAYHHGYGSLTEAEFQFNIKQGYAIVVNVRDGSHWVLVTGYAGGSTYTGQLDTHSSSHCIVVTMNRERIESNDAHIRRRVLVAV